MAGSKFAGNQAPGSAWKGEAVYGTEGVAAPGNTPGAREVASGWADPSGNLWLFGGQGIVSAPGSVGLAAIGNMNDLWKYSNGEWTWMAGSDQINQDGVYGTLGTPAPDNTPGWRDGAASWTDASGNLWLFGGLGAGAPGAGENCSGCEMNDLWKYSNGMWTWMGGPDMPGYSGVYGTEPRA